jgi:hypothetical protein
VWVSLTCVAREAARSGVLCSSPPSFLIATASAPRSGEPCSRLSTTAVTSASCAGESSASAFIAEAAADAALEGDSELSSPVAVVDVCAAAVAAADVFES